MNEMTRILVVDDDQDLLKLVATGLREEGYTVLTAADAHQALKLAYQEHPDLVILDIMLPGMDGIEVCRRLRELTDVPIIMLTAMSREQDVVRGLAAGADDYVTKPFGMAELLARVQACLRRKAGAPDERKTTITVGDMTIDLARHKVIVRGEPVDLTPTEFRLLSYLARHKGYVIHHERLLTEVWGPEYRDQLDYLRLYISYLRRKIEKDPSNPEIIKTERGVGYYLDG